MTELIASAKPVVATGRELVIITTASGATIWVPKAQYDASAEQVNYVAKKKGDKYTKKDGTEGVLTSDRNEYLGCGKQIVKKHDTLSVMDYLISKGITPTFSMS